ncbi:MAG: hypothetical protein H7A23_17660 [Leptospiraceae bacterium]|nr:hypothetical protein [Leptospiraceae bacterium]MCP5496377.1 hypothetical protein [Leptospiraceae bacterium]
MSELMHVKFHGNHISPEKLSLSELSDVLVNLEKSILPIISMKNPDIANEFSLSLSRIEKGSLALSFQSSHFSNLREAFFFLKDLVDTDSLYKLPYKSIEPFKKIYSFIKEKAISMELSDSSEVIMNLLYSHELDIPEKFSLSGETTIYGRLLRIGGKSPSVQIQINDKEIITCSASEKIVKMLEKANRLYEYVGVTGEAKWNPDDYSIQSLDIERIENYEQADPSNIMAELSKEIGHYFKNINPEQYVSELRD